MDKRRDWDNMPRGGVDIITLSEQIESGDLDNLNEF